MTEKVKINLDWPVPTSKDLVPETEIPVERKMDEKESAKYAENHEIFVEKKGWWPKEPTRGKNLLGIKIEVDGKEHYFWPGAEDFHKLLIGFILVTAKNDQQTPETNPDLIYKKSRIVEKDLNVVKSLLEDCLSKLQHVYGQEWLDQFLEGWNET